MFIMELTEKQVDKLVPIIVESLNKEYDSKLEAVLEQMVIAKNYKIDYEFKNK